MIEGIHHCRHADEVPAVVRAQLSAGTLDLFERWPQQLDDLPESLAFAHDDLAHRTPVIEHAYFGHHRRSYWNVRFLHAPHSPCFAASGVCRAKRALPAGLQWLADTFGTLSLELECSGTAPLGWPFPDMMHSNAFLFCSDPAPPGSATWVCLYEADGDALVLDLSTGTVHWAGHEWTGEAVTQMPVNATTVAQVLTRCALEGRYLRPSDLTDAVP